MRWIFEWEDASGDSDRDVKITSDSIDEYRDCLKRLLTGQTVTISPADGFETDQDALSYFAEEVFDYKTDEASIMSWEDYELECGDGTLRITREH